jgi:RimJ/RimL family protein N-acetyltransferase
MSLRLRPFSPLADEHVLRELRSDIPLQHRLLAHPDQGAPVDVQAWVRRREALGWFRVIELNGSITAGFVQLTDLHGIDRYGWVGIALHPRLQGSGWGRRAMMALAEEAKVSLDLRKLMLQVRSDNQNALHLYATLGYRVVGHLNRHYFDGVRYHDVTMMEQLLEGS